MPSSQTNLYLCSLIACLTASLFGYSVGFIGGILVLPSFLHSFHLSSLSPSDLAISQARIVSIWLIGAFLGVPLGMPICSRFGRKRCLSVSALLYVLGTGLQLVGNGSVAVFEAGRWLNGLGVGCGTLVSPMYISEISPASARGMLMSGYQTILQVSALAGFWGAYASNAVIASSSSLQWQIPVAVQLLPGASLLLGTLLIPESPRFLAEKGRYEALETSLMWLRSLSAEDWDLQKEVEEVSEAARIGTLLGQSQQSFLSEVVKKGVRQRLVVGIGLMIAQNMVGLNALNYYAPVIFMSAGFTSISSSLFLTGIFGVVKLVSAIAFMFVFIQVKGNRFWLLFGSALCALTMLVLAYCVRIMPPPDSLREAKLTLGGVISVLAVYTFAFSFSVSLGPISWNVCSEIFPIHINAKCCTITTCTQWLFQIVIAYITPRLIASAGWLTYFIYAIFCILTCIWVFFCVPETRGVALGTEMDEVFGISVGEDEEDDLGISETERTMLLKKDAEGRRRGSFAAYN